jgi:uncharacterized membrane protein
MPRSLPACLALSLLAACAPPAADSPDPAPGAATATAPAPAPMGVVTDAAAPPAAARPDEQVSMVGTEPFWALTIKGDKAVWTTPEVQPGTAFAVTRFVGNGGLSFSGTLDGQPLTATLTPGQCSDGMSERSFPFVATIALGGETLAGCGYTDSQPFTGPEAP